MCLYSIDYLIVLVALSGYEHYGSVWSRHYGGSYGLFPVGDEQCLSQSVAVKSFFHVCDDILRPLESRIVRCDDYAVCVFGTDGGHFPALASVSVSSTAEHGCHTCLSAYLADGSQDILEGIGSMGVVHYGGYAASAFEVFHSSGHWSHCADSSESLGAVCSHEYGGTVYCAYIVGIVVAYEARPDINPIDVEHVAFETPLHYPYLELRHTAFRVSVYAGGCVLDHYGGVPVI